MTPAPGARDFVDWKDLARVSYRTPRILTPAPADPELTDPIARIRRAFQARSGTSVRSDRRSPRIASPSRRVLDESEAPQSAPCKRRMKRRQTSLPGLITFANMRLELPCMIADLSATGARLVMPPTSLQLVGSLEHLPNDLMLALRADRTEVPCQIRWRLPMSLGVRFEGPALPISKPRH